MKKPVEVRVWTWCGVAALALTVGIMSRRKGGGDRTSAPEELRDAVASPALLPGARIPPFAAAAPRAPLGAKKPRMAARLRRFADALDAEAARLSRPVEPR